MVCTVVEYGILEMEKHITAERTDQNPPPLSLPSLPSIWERNNFTVVLG